MCEESGMCSQLVVGAHLGGQVSGTEEQLQRRDRQSGGEGR